MCDIQVMYYQMQVHAEQRSVLRFLWCEDVNLGGNLLEHEMFVYVFGGSSSPVCCHYALRKTAIGNEIRFGEEASQTLLHNFSLSQWKLKN